MERLTKRHSPSSVTINPHVSGNVYLKLADYEDAEELCIEECGCSLRMVIEKYKEFLEDMVELAEYRQAEEQGLLLRLPCAIGGTIYKFEYPTIYDENGDGWTIIDKKRATVAPLKFALCHLDSIGKLYYLTREEAEQALKQMGER